MGRWAVVCFGWKFSANVKFSSNLLSDIAVTKWRCAMLMLSHWFRCGGLSKIGKSVEWRMSPADVSIDGERMLAMTRCVCGFCTLFGNFNWREEFGGDAHPSWRERERPLRGQGALTFLALPMLLFLVTSLAVYFWLAFSTIGFTLAMWVMAVCLLWQVCKA